MNYLSDLDNFILTNDPLIHILKHLYYEDLLTLKCVNKFYNNNKYVSVELKIKKQQKEQLIINKLTSYTDTVHDLSFHFYYTILNLMTHKTIINITLKIKKLPTNGTYLKLYWFDAKKPFIRLSSKIYWTNVNRIFEQYADNHVYILFDESDTHLVFNNKKSRTHIEKLRKVFMEIDNDNIFDTFKKYYY